MAPSGNALRQAFIDFFVQAGHTHVPSAPLVPHGDASLMFVNAGMVPFKNVFVGQEQRPYLRAVSSQKCMRVSGKHNDLEEVGRTARHHTLFEMLGNFSFGDYFKEQAITYAWQFVQQVLALPKERLYVTVFAGEGDMPEDDEARRLWKRISGLPDSRILSFGAKDNFWSMGETGPCGPCTEIHVDLGEGPVTPADFESGRIVEIWNNVFMQYERHADGRRTPLPKPAVDTGMGLERVAALAQGQTSNYHSDLFLPLLAAIGEVAKRTYGRSASEEDVSMRVVADHARALCFLVADGVQPGADGRGYVLRRILRRAIRHGQKLGIERTFLPDVAQVVVREMGGAYPELKTAEKLIAQVAAQEEEAFRRTLGSGLKVLSAALDATLGNLQTDTATPQRPTVLSGEVAFKLYDTYGFPKDLTALIASERHIALDEAGFAACMREQQERSRGARDGATNDHQAVYRQIVIAHGPTQFVGYRHESHSDDAREGQWQRHGDLLAARVRLVALIDAERGEQVQTVSAGSRAFAVLSPCPLYGEGGGQVGDIGRLLADDGPADPPGAALADVTDAKRPIPELTVAQLQTHAPLTAGQWLWAGYPVDRRLATRAHHSATHLLHGALRTVLGDHVTQAGSLVDPTYLRFDFAHGQALTAAERDAIEDDVNRRIQAGRPVVTEEMAIDAAQQKGALALFGEKYADSVRVISMGESIELCGGTHADNTGELQLLLLQRDQAVKAGVRRLMAEVGPAAHARGRQWLALLAATAARLGADKLADTLAQAADFAGRAPAMAHVADTPEWQDTQAALTRLQDTIAAHNAAAAQADGEEADHDDDDEGGMVPLPVTPQALGLTLPAVGTARDLAFWRPIRATWQAIGQLLGGKWSDASAVRAGLGDADVGHLAGGVFNLLASEREAARLRQQADARAQARGAKDLASAAEALPNGITILCHRVPDAQSADLKALADTVRDRLGSVAVCLAHAQGETVRLLVARTPDLDGRVHAGKLIALVAPCIGGKGGGRPDMAQAGGRDPSGIERAFAALREAIGAR